MPGPRGVAGPRGLAGWPGLPGVFRLPEQQHAMNMVWHDHKGIKLHMREMTRDLIPTAHCRVTCGVALHCPVQDPTEEAGVSARAAGRTCPAPTGAGI